MSTQSPDRVVLTSDEAAAPPRWAILQRLLFEAMSRAGAAFVSRYTRGDGTLVWRDRWPGMDGSDDGYESFTSFPLVYAMGGDEPLQQLARRQWDAVTWQFTEYGQVHREFDAFYDWMHHGESSTYLYYLALADPTVHKERVRARRFAAMYIGEDPEAPNWDPALQMMRSPINGSRGPRFEMTAEDWCTHRPILAEYLCPYEDVPGFPAGGDPATRLDWNDDAVFERILARMNQRMVPGDVPLNLTATSLVTHAYLYTGDPRYRDWVLGYLKAWERRTRQNDGIMPDNVGPSGVIGERMGGKWWGGYYGWRWPHGSMNLLESATIAGANALLMTGDASHLDLARSQLDMLWELGRTEEGTYKLPHRHGDGGWFDYRPPDPELALHIAWLTEDPADLERLARFSGRNGQADVAGFGKGGQFGSAPWRAFNEGGNPAYPEQVLEATYDELCRRLRVMRDDDGDPAEWDVHHWQDINPVLDRALLQLTMGTPGVIYHGGHVHSAVRHFDPARRRAGLPAGVAALVEQVRAQSVTLHLVNTDPVAAHEVLVQAGAFGEHRFTGADVLGAADQSTGIESGTFGVRLGPGSRLRVRLGLARHVNRPGYAHPWPAP